MDSEHEIDSGLLVSVEALTTAIDRGKANGAVADNDGND
jgi:hypothetical protein